MIIRTIHPGDAEQFLNLCRKLDDETAFMLYKKRGFAIEGTKKHSLLINGQYVDEYYMAKLLE